MEKGAKVDQSRPESLGDTAEPFGGVMGFLIATPMKVGVYLMTLMKSLAPLATHPFDVISCPQFLEVLTVPQYIQHTLHNTCITIHTTTLSSRIYIPS